MMSLTVMTAPSLNHIRCADASVRLPSMVHVRSVGTPFISTPNDCDPCNVTPVNQKEMVHQLGRI